MIDNYNENYHTPNVHPVLASSLDMNDYQVLTHGMYFRHASGVNEDPLEVASRWTKKPTTATTPGGCGPICVRCVSPVAGFGCCT